MCFCKLFLLLRESQYFYTILPRVWNNAFRALVIFSICVKSKKEKKSKFTVKLKLKLKNWLLMYLSTTSFFSMHFLCHTFTYQLDAIKNFLRESKDGEITFVPYFPILNVLSERKKLQLRYYNFPLFICTWMIKLSKYISIIGHIALFRKSYFNFEDYFQVMYVIFAHTLF